MPVKVFLALSEILSLIILVRLHGEKGGCHDVNVKKNYLEKCSLEFKNKVDNF